MPELPDVENFRRYLADHGLNKTIAGVSVGSVKVLEAMSADQLETAVTDRKMTAAKRHGKHVLAPLDDGPWLHFHFGMTGYFFYFSEGTADPKHDRLRLTFAGGGHHLAFVNQRLLGRVGLTPDLPTFIEAKDLGPDALSMGEESFRIAFENRRGQVKSALMDQTLLAGIGNVYSDEILFDAKLHPKAPVPELDPETLADLYKSMGRVLEMAIARGAGSEDVEEKVPDTWLLPHRRDGEICRRCGGEIRAIKVQGRTAYYCPGCQPAP